MTIDNIKGICIDDRWSGKATGIGKRWRVRVRDSRANRYDSMAFDDYEAGVQWAKDRVSDLQFGPDVSGPTSFEHWGKCYLDHLSQKNFDPRYLRQAQVAIERLVEAGAHDMRNAHFIEKVEQCIHRLTTAMKGGVMSPAHAGAPIKVRPSNKPASANTKNFHLKMANAVCTLAVKNIAIPYNPLSVVSPIPVTAELKKTFSVAELQRLIDVRSTDDHWHLFTALLIYTGASASEVCSLTWPMIDWDKQTITIPGSLVGKKLKIARAVPLQTELRTLLEPIKQQGTGTLIAAPLLRLSAGSITRGFQDYCTRRGVTAAGRGPQCLKHTFCAIMTAMSVNSAFTMALVGNSEQVTAQRYAERAIAMNDQITGWPSGDFHILRTTPSNNAQPSIA